NMTHQIGRPIMAFLMLACACQLSGCTIGGGNSEESGFTATAQGGLLLAETGAEPAPGYSDGSVPWEATDEHIVNVSVQPEAAISLGDNRVVMGVGGVPYSEPQAGPGHSAGLECDALDAYATGNAGPSEVQGLTFDPNGSSAWACFELKRDDNLPDSLAIA